MNKNLLQTKLLHCFGTQQSTKVTPEMAAKMISASGIKEIPINTHNIDDITDWRDLPIGYGRASWNTVSDYMDLSDCKPLWNINLPKSSEEAVARAEKAVKIGGKQPIKFEVLDSTLRWSNNSEVLKAVNYLVSINKFEVWPLIAPDYDDFNELQNLNCPIIRIMGSPISSNQGILPKYIPTVKKIIANKNALVMLDGGVGSIETIKQAISLGFDHILVNSWLFNGNNILDILESILKILD